MKKELQEARNNWKALENSYCYITHMNTKDAQLKIRPSKKETFTHARVPDAETVARLETALQKIADLKMELLHANVAAPQMQPSKKETCAPAKSVNEKKTLNPAKPAVAGTAARHVKTRAAARIAAKGQSVRKILKGARWQKRVTTLQLEQEAEREAKRHCSEEPGARWAKRVATLQLKQEAKREAKRRYGKEPFPAGLTGSRDHRRAARLASLQSQIACLEEMQSAQRTTRSGSKSHSDGDRHESWYTPMPWELIGMEPHTTNGARICFNHNLPKGCDKADEGGMCPKGLHVCMRRKCEE